MNHVNYSRYVETCMLFRPFAMGGGGIFAMHQIFFEIVLKRFSADSIGFTVMSYETSKLITSDTDLERGNAQRERWKIATTC